MKYEATFDQILTLGAEGRNGEAATKGIAVDEDYQSNRLQLKPLKTNGDPLSKCRIDFPVDKTGDLVKTIVEAAVAHSPHIKDKLASELRAALIALEFAAPEPERENIARYGI